MKFLTRILLASIFFLVSNLPSNAEDLFDQKNPDTAIKMIHFPKSLAIIEHTSMPMEGTPEPKSDSKTITRILKKLDPARITPAKGIIRTDQEINRDSLDQLEKETESDILLVFRREVLEADPTKVKMLIRALVYFTEQKKLLPLPDQPIETALIQYANAQANAFKKLAESARRIILSWKFEKRQSAY